MSPRPPYWAPTCGGWWSCRTWRWDERRRERRKRGTAGDQPLPCPPALTKNHHHSPFSLRQADMMNPHDSAASLNTWMVRLGIYVARLAHFVHTNTPLFFSLTHPIHFFFLFSSLSETRVRPPGRLDRPLHPVRPLGAWLSARGLDSPARAGPQKRGRGD